MSDQQMDTVLAETRKFSPPEDFSSKAHIQSMEDYKALHQRSIQDPEGFWSEVASELHWFRKWDTVLNDDDKPFFKWFEGGKTNISYNCLDRHLDGPNRDKPAIIWEGEPGESKTLTYAEMHSLVCRFANVLKSLGVKKGDRVAIYLPMVVELPAAVLACARIGAVHNVVFAGFSSESIKDRVLDSEAKLVITADAGWRRGKVLALKDIVDAAVEDCDCVENVLVVERGIKEEFPLNIKQGRDHWYHELAENQSDDCPAEELDAEDMLFLLYTSGTTGKPKGIMHTQAGYMVYTYLTAKYVFDLKPEDVYWCTADVGWITGHSYLIYGPMQNAATVVVYEGAPNWPDNGRFWEIVEKYQVSIFYTAPTAIRAFMKWGDEWPKKCDLSSLRLLGTVGEAINPEAWIWYHELIGGKRCPIVDTYWQTETGGIILSPLPGVTPTKPGSATLPFFGIDPAVLTDEGEEVRAGILSVRQPWPGMTRGIWGDSQRFKDTYWCKWGGQYYFPGDGARKDEDDYIWILGRVDDVVNVSGHRIGTAELESIYVEHPSVAESAVIGVAHEIKGQGLVSFVTVRQGLEGSDELRKELNGLVAQKIGKFALPARIVF